MRCLRMILSWMTILACILLVFSASSRCDDLPELTKNDGPYMVLAYRFRGPDAEQSARALANELNKDHDLPSFVSSPPGKNGSLQFDVLVGNCKTNKEAFYLCKKVKKIKAKCLNDDPKRTKGSGLSRAMTTTNPLAKIE